MVSSAKFRKLSCVFCGKNVYTAPHEETGTGSATPSGVSPHPEKLHSCVFCFLPWHNACADRCIQSAPLGFKDGWWSTDHKLAFQSLPAELKRIARFFDVSSDDAPSSSKRTEHACCSFQFTLSSTACICFGILPCAISIRTQHMRSPCPLCASLISSLSEEDTNAKTNSGMQICSWH